MKTDRELLELAAKAAGINGKFVERMPNDGYPGYSCGITFGNQLVMWNPLTDDGDALRLANMLMFCIDQQPNCIYIGTADGKDISAEPVASAIPRDRATRRAIVRAAAFIGEAMP